MDLVTAVSVSFRRAEPVWEGLKNQQTPSMPGLTSLPLNLSEILEARRGPLRELEIWALLCQCAEALQDLIIKGEACGDNAFRRMITPNTLLVRDNGTVTLTENAQSPQGSLYMAPEFEPDSRHFISDAAFEKMFVYSLGRTLQVASEFGLQENEVLGISYDLDSLLQAMSEKNAAFRLSLMQILEACSLQASQNPDKLPHSLVLSRLYKSILGGNLKRSFNDSNYGSEHSHEAVMSHQPGRARRPRPQVRHRHIRRRRTSTSSTSSANYSRSRSRSRSLGRKTDLSHGPSAAPASYPAMPSDSKSELAQATSTFTTPTSSQLLNTSMTSTSSEMSALARMQQAPPYSAAHSVEGLLGLRQGSPAYQKYIKLKERQIRRRQAKCGDGSSVLDELRSRIMTPPLMSSEMVDNLSDTHSMASLMSYTLGTYKPYLHADFGSEAALNFVHDTTAEHGSQVSLLLSGVDYGSFLRAQALPSVTSAHQTAYLNQGSQSSTDPQLASGATETLMAAIYSPPHQKQQPQHLKEQPVAATTADAAMTAVTPIQRTESFSESSREFDGSEFVFNLKKPAIRVAMPLQGDSVKNAHLARRVTVVHLTGQKFEVVLDPSSTGRQLFDTVIPYLELDDFFFFGLTYISEGEHFFLDADTKLHKVAPEGWKDGPKGHQSYVTFNLNVQVKFYPESLIDFRHASSHHLLYLQLRQDVLEERVTADPDLLFKLAGLALQAEYGDCTKEKASEGQQQGTSALPPYFTAEYYISRKVLRQAGASVVYTKVMRRHKANAGLSKLHAELEFIKVVRSLPEYGIHFYKLSKGKNQSDSLVWVGLSQHNFAVAEPTMSSTRTITQSHPWGNILKISFNRRRFSLQPKMEEARGKPPKINFYTNSYRKGRYLLQFSTEQHRFEIRMKTRISNLETTEGTAAVETSPQSLDSVAAVTSAGNKDVPVAQMHVDPAQQPLPHDDEEDNLDEDWGLQNERENEQPLRYRSPPPYQPPRMAEILGGDQVFPGTEDPATHVSLADLHSSEFDKHHLQTLLDMSSTTQSLDFVPASNNDDSEAPVPSRHSLKTDISPLGRRIFEVTLEKESGHGVGITIVGGETTSSLDLGIFVKSVVPGGPAERDGRIKYGDRLIAIGATSLEGKQHHEAVAMIRDSGPRVTFLVSQVRPPGTVKKRRSPTQAREQEQFEKKLRDSELKYRNTADFQDQGGGANSLLGRDIGDDRMNETLLHFDDFVTKHSLSASDSDQECNSDEENDLLEPPPTPPEPTQPLRTPSSIPNTHPFDQQQIFSQPHMIEVGEQRVPNSGSAPLPPLNSQNQIKSHLVPDLAARAFQQSSNMEQQRKALAEDREFLKLQDDEDLARALVEESGTWPREEGLPSSMGYHSAPLTEEEQEGLQILGDIAALDADGSSSDSDFDSAIKKTIDGPSSSIYPGSKAVNTVSPMVFTAQNKKPQSSSDVIYEVVLEKDRESRALGLVVHPIVSQDKVNPQTRDGVYIQEILPNSPADRGGILAPGDRILEVIGQSVVEKDSKAVQDLLNSAPNLTTVKVSRSMEKDAALNSRVLQTDKQPLNQVNGSTDIKRMEEHDGPQVPLTALISQAPAEALAPLYDLHIVPPPPPLNLGFDVSESNTQSDVDSDVLDSSKSDIAGFPQIAENFAAHHPVSAAPTSEETPVHGKSMPQPVLEGDDNWQMTRDKKPGEDITSEILKLDDSSEFDEKLDALKTELDKQLAREDASPNSLSKSSDSSTDSVVRSPRKLIESLDSKAKEEEEETDIEEEDQAEDDHDDDDDVVVTMYGDELVKEKSFPKAKSKKKAKKQAEEDILDPFEPVLLNVSLKRQREGFGFTVAGGVSTGGCYIKQLVSEPAISDGRLRPGDKILMVNGQDSTGYGHVETVTLLRKQTKVAHLRLLRFPSSMETQQRVQAAQAQAQRATANPEPGVEVSDASEESQADKSVQGLTTVVDAPKATIHPYDHKGSIVAKADIHKLEVGNSMPDHDTPDGNLQTQEAGVFRVELTRPAHSQAVLGITLTQREQDGQSLVCVKRLKAGGLASRDGRLRPLDTILQVNGASFIGMTVRQAVSCLRGAGDKVILTISRSEMSVTTDEVVTDKDCEGIEDAGVSDDDISTLAEEASSLLQEGPGFRRVPGGQYDTFRKPQTDMPVVLSEEWLNDLPLMRMAVDKEKEYTRSILQNIADLVESGEPHEAFKNIRQLKEAGPCSIGQLPENKPKNRYRNVLPYDGNRVKLSGRGESKEYINASYIEMPLTSYTTSASTTNVSGDDGYPKDRSKTYGEKSAKEGNVNGRSPIESSGSNKCLKYIACQGPVEGTVSDFWAMVWQERIHVVAMLTQAQEGGKLKCHPYWPRSKAEVLSVDDGALLVRLVRSYSLRELDVVEVTMEEAAASQSRQEVILLQYRGWPDHGAPDTALPLLQLLQVMHLLESGSPPVIHCSAGIGRTGALVAIDVALACIEHGIEFNLHDIVCKLRTQRQGMVQTTDQYLFCYSACMEALLSMDSGDNLDEHFLTW